MATIPISEVVAEILDKPIQDPLTVACELTFGAPAYVGKFLSEVPVAEQPQMMEHVPDSTDQPEQWSTPSTHEVAPAPSMSAVAPTNT